MKNLSNMFSSAKLHYFFLAAAILFSSIIPVSAKNKNSIQFNSFDAVFYLEKAGNIHVNVDVKKASRMQIQIKDEQGSVLHQELIHGNLHRFGMSFNCSSLPDGEYHIEISNGRDSELKQFSIIKNQVQQLKIIN
ncbi:hypothetical protein L0663_01795 [Dyadobacter sp. CY107]|uniref:hypothetical protein n=1 Tax=Dyadobacter fanqingshengii TaxID=2906443 RepID=UPI001F46D6E1|nr:hypothetical protein [Dyadobacter fanqingshengii]MCF2502098.1 hypothetical protein [Dyadobacter fanqingshengii]